jgi:hypothetical protein
VDDLDQLAAAIRPSWEFDEAPFVGAGSISPADLQALQGGGGTHADVRAVAQAAAVPASNGAHAPTKPIAAAHEPEDSVVIDRSITAAEIAPTPPPAAPEPARAPLAPPAAAAVQVTRGAADRLAQTRIVRRVPQIAAPRESTGSFDARALGRSKRPLWIGLGAGAVVLVALGIWATSGSSEAPAAVPPPPARTAHVAAPDIPPPPPETTPEPPPPAPPPPKTVPVSALAQVPPPVVTPASLPPAPARPVAAPAAPPAPPRPVVAPTPKPATRPKSGGGGTIVHDVPF